MGKQTGRPRIEKKSSDRRLELTLENVPAWVTFQDVQHLLKLHQGSGFGRKAWLRLVATKVIPGYSMPGSQQIRYKWPEVISAIDGAMKRVG